MSGPPSRRSAYSADRWFRASRPTPLRPGAINAGLFARQSTLGSCATPTTLLLRAAQLVVEQHRGRHGSFWAPLVVRASGPRVLTQGADGHHLTKKPDQGLPPALLRRSHIAPAHRAPTRLRTASAPAAPRRQADDACPLSVVQTATLEHGAVRRWRSGTLAYRTCPNLRYTFGRNNIRQGALAVSNPRSTFRLCYRHTEGERRWQPSSH